MDRNEKDILLYIQAELVKINIKLAVMEVDLRHHIKRSDKHEKLLMAIIFSALMAGGASAKYLFPMLGKIF